MKGSWWTQPRLAFLACVLFAGPYVAIVALSPGLALRVPLLLAWAAAVSLGYRHICRFVAHGHETRATTAAFDRAVWQRRWRTRDPFESGDLLALLSGDKYEESEDRFHRALTGAVLPFEAARLVVRANTVAMGVGLSAGALFGVWSWTSAVAAGVVGGLLIPITVVSQLSVLVDSHAGRRLLETRTVRRVALLKARRFEDLIGSSGAFFAVSAVFLVALYAGYGWYSWSDNPVDGGAVFVAGLGLIGCLAATWYALRQVPFLRFEGPSLVSVYVDYEVRGARILLLMLTAAQFCMAIRGLMRGTGIEVGHIAAAILVVAATGYFSFRPDSMGRGGAEDLAGRLRRLERRWGLTAPENEDAAASLQPAHDATS